MTTSGVENVVLNDKPWPKGYLGGECNRGACTHNLLEHDAYWSSVERAYYCEPCALEINKWVPPGVAPMVKV